MSIRVSLRIPDVKMREIDAAWTQQGGMINRSEGLRWIINRGLEKVREDGL
jgi:metal-responsive CopG/Arc/MetJ family transcriptional regulator